MTQHYFMKSLPLSKVLAATLLATAMVLSAGAETKEKEAKAKPYALKTCLVSDEKLDSDPAMKSYAFTHEGQEIKLCCKSCLKDFKKDSKTYLKKLAEETAKQEKGKKKA